MAQAGSVLTRKPAKWVLAHDHGLHPVTRIKEFWRYRRLIWFFATEAFQTLYKRTKLGWLWVPIRPLAPLLVGVIVYGGVMGVPITGVPYFIFLLVGMIAWNCFDGPWMWGSRGLERNRDLVTKLYFPRMILPLATMSPGLAEPMVMVGVLLVALPYFRVVDGVWYLQIGPQILLAPLILATLLFLAFSLSLWTSLWQARARDVRYIVGYGLGFWMYVTPVIYPVTQVPTDYRWLVWLNPLAPLVESFKASLFGWAWPPEWAFGVAGAEILAVFATGFWHFHVKEAEATDRI